MCTCPNYMVWNGRFNEEGRHEFDFSPHVNYDKLLKSGAFFIEVGCGKCLECRQQHVSEWADRCVLHAKQFEHNAFITLTYDDEHLPADGSVVDNEISSFIKRLRRYFSYHGIDKKISYLGCAEYGSEQARPHYHIIIFNCDLPDLSNVFLREENGRLIKSIKPDGSAKLQFSKIIYDIWQRKGLISVGEVNYASCAYVAGYVEKKTDLRHMSAIKKAGLKPEFIRMSKGIGKNIFDVDMFDKPLIIPNSGKAKISKVPRYFEKLLEKKDELQYLILKRKQAEKRKVLINNYEHSNRLKDLDNFGRNSILQTKYNRHI